MTTYDICAAVVSDLQYDARVWKEVRSLARAGYRVKLIGCRYEIDRVQRRAEDEIDIVEVPLGTRAGRISEFSRARTLLRVWWEILRTNAYAYHVHNIHPGPAAWLVSVVRRARLVYDGHELYGDEGQAGIPGGRVAARASIRLERLLIRRSDVAITTNASRARVLEERHGRPVRVLANVPSVVQDVRPLDPGYPAQGNVLLYQGGIYPERAFYEVVRAVALVDDLQLVILGFGRDGAIEQIRDWARDAGVGHRVHILPPRPFDELVRTAAAATIGIVPLKGERLNHRLGDTNKLHEYLMAGLPVVASDLPEIRLVVQEGEPPVGELFDPDSPESIARAISKILSDPEQYAQRRAEARRLALERFNWGIEERNLIDWYRTLITNQSNGGTTREAGSSGG
jgi:glycosyltransferase involved in cell wall biosynthesis